MSLAVFSVSSIGAHLKVVQPPYLILQTAQMKAEVGDLRKEVQLSRLRSGKLEYRVQHLCAAVLDGDKSLHEAMTADPEKREQLLKKHEALLVCHKAQNGKLQDMQPA